MINSDQVMLKERLAVDSQL